MKIYFIKFNLIFLLSIRISNITSQIPSNDPSWLYVGGDECNTNFTLNNGFWMVGNPIYNPITNQLSGYTNWLDWRANLACRCDGGSPVTHDLMCARTETDVLINPPNGSNPGYIRLRTVASQTTVQGGVSQCGLPPFLSCASPQILQGTYTYPYRTPKWLRSSTKYKFGYFEIRCRFPQLGPSQTNNGLGANFWLREDDGVNLDSNDICNSNYSNCFWRSEIDIFEILGSGIPNFNTAKHEWGNNSWLQEHENYHCPPPSEMEQKYRGMPDNFQVPNDGDWHTFSASWTPNRIDFYFDGNYLNSSFNYPFLMEALRVIVDVNVFKGPIADATTANPYNYDIDYVRIHGIRVPLIGIQFHNNNNRLIYTTSNPREKKQFI